MRLAFVVFLMALFAVPVFAFDADSSCVKCHGDKEMVTKLGYPQMYLDPATIDKEVNMGGIPCESCHLGNPSSMNKDEAHKGMPRPFYAAVGKNHKYQAVSRDITNFDPITPKGKDRTKLLMRKADPDKAKALGIKQIAQLYYHDHDPVTMAYDPSIAKSTCGACHEKEVTDYDKSGMGLQKTQRGFTHWTKGKPGPQNCGPWFGDNYEKIKGECTRGDAYTKEQAAGSDRGCNKCHASCTDCHYQGFKATPGRHTFSKAPETLSCYGSGKETVCHAGPMDRRRGAGYMRGEFAFPANELPDDVHNANGVKCIDCHEMKDHSYGHIGSENARQSCNKCHKEIVDAVKASDHKNVDCSSCHIQQVGAYQMTFWGPGKSEGIQNLFTKHKEYYGVRNEPLLVKQPKTGLWIPLKPYPMGTMNVSTKPDNIGKLLLRDIPKTTVKGNTSIGQPESFDVERGAEQVNDMYIITGLFKGFGLDDKMLGWIQMDKMSHSIGKARDCASCHSSHAQTSTSWYTYELANDVKKPFSGSYTVTADKNGIRFENFKNTEIVPADGMDVNDFAPFVKNNKAWNVKGIDMELKFNDKKYAAGLGDYQIAYADLNNRIAKEKDPAKLAQLNKIKAIMYHNSAMAEQMLKDIK